VSDVAVRVRALSPLGFLRLAASSCVALFIVVTSGAFVRLTGSGLGCDNWPRCGDKPYPERGYHAFVEFGNRMVALVGIVLTLVTWLAARRMEGLPRFARLAALGAFLVAVAQIPLGAVTIALDLHPLAVMAHFLLGLAVLGFAVVLLLEAWILVDGRAGPAGPRWLRNLTTWAGVPACIALVVTGAVATASGPHPGADEAVERLGLAITDTVYVHVRVAAAFGIGVLFVGWFLVRLRREYPGLLRLWAALLAALVAQAIVGEVQYRNALPWGLVLVHVSLAAMIWALTLAVAYALWRLPAPLARHEVAGAERTQRAPSDRATPDHVTGKDLPT
jgi:cytochrome c oxidase assembly protein subunit 15